ncbi:BamA/TamA family outer membrane protein [Flavobacterium sp.]|uniref:translocation and assembly module lipoprotein TamL n=1 Tax=Flavobacterium sp. TaxID=239 RepID=UPI002611F993|nr:BamA/TamA family outer membrane protein [Flavobacterium sp.]
MVLLKAGLTKIAVFLLALTILSGCNSTKRVKEAELLLTKNTILVDGKKSNDELLEALLYQKPNSNFLGYKLRLQLYNIAKKNPDSSYKAKYLNNPAKFKRQSKIFSAKQVRRRGKSFLYSGLDKFLKKTGEAPVIIRNERIEKSKLRIQAFLSNKGYFRNKVSSKIDTIGKKKGRVTYTINRGKRATIDSLTHKIYTPALDSLYRQISSQALLKVGEPFDAEIFDAERNRITTYFRNHGALEFQQSSIVYDIDTIKTGGKTYVKLIINDQAVREGDSTATRPFKLYTISEINIYTDQPKDKKSARVKDSINYKGFNVFSFQKLKYRPKAITDAIFLNPGNEYADFRANLTTRSLNNLKIFNQPTLQFKPDPTNENKLIANIYLSPKEKYYFLTSLDLTHSNVQDFGIAASASVTIRNVFNGAETLLVAMRGNIGSSTDLANPDNTFFNISEYGIDSRLSFPRILFPFKTDKIIPKSMLPSTSINLGFAKQRNIGLDKENFTGAMTYNWTPDRNKTARFDLFNIQYVNNVNVNNYFNVYRSSYAALNEIAQNVSTNDSYFSPTNGNLLVPEGTSGFTSDVLNNLTTLVPTDRDYREVRSIEERRRRLTENNLILASSYSYSRTTKANLVDNNFFTIRFKAESAGNVLSLFAGTANSLNAQSTGKQIFGVEFSQYAKGEFEFIKHWDLRREKVLAIRTFFGMAVPYGNSTNIPFSRSYFAGGSNDIRAWQPYRLGPGSSGARNDFNEANMKLLANAELRFKIVNKFKGAVFVDAGNIWNVLDDATLAESKFEGLQSLKDIAVGSGFGLRYDFSFFVLRSDFGFKTYNPAETYNKRWFRDYNLANMVVNIGINYPF